MQTYNGSVKLSWTSYRGPTVLDDITSVTLKLNIIKLKDNDRLPLLNQYDVNVSIN